METELAIRLRDDQTRYLTQVENTKYRAVLRRETSTHTHFFYMSGCRQDLNMDPSTTQFAALYRRADLIIEMDL